MYPIEAEKREKGITNLTFENEGEARDTTQIIHLTSRDRDWNIYARSSNSPVNSYFGKKILWTHKLYMMIKDTLTASEQRDAGNKNKRCISNLFSKVKCSQSLKSTQNGQDIWSRNQNEVALEKYENRKFGRKIRVSNYLWFEYINDLK